MVSSLWLNVFTLIMFTLVEALLLRYIVCTNEMDSDSREDFVRSKANSLGLEEFVEHNTSFLGIRSKYKSQLKDKENSNTTLEDGCSKCPTYALPFLQPEECEDSQQRLVDDPFYVDKRTGIPLQCLSFLVTHLFPKFSILTYTVAMADTEVNGTLFRYLGSSSSGTNVHLRDIMPTVFARTKNKNSREYGATVVALTSDVSQSSLVQDVETTYPGYLRLKVPPSSTCFSPKNLHRSEGYTYLKKLIVPGELTRPRYANKCFMGFDCKEFPSVAVEWIYRQRQFQWPSNEVIKMIQTSGCTIIPKHHPSSSQPGIEWKYDFSLSEAILFQRGLSFYQLYGFYVVKILLDRCTSHLNCRLKNKHIRSVFFNSCEHIPSKMWISNLGGCILYIVSYLTKCLQTKNLPNHFISKRNMLLSFNDEDVKDIYIQMEALRLFPHQTMVHISEFHGFRYATNLATLILKNCKRFSPSSELWSAYRDILMPGTIKTVKFLSRRGLYEMASTILARMFDDQFLFQNALSRSSGIYYTTAEFFCNALGNLNQEISKAILAMRYEIIFEKRILDMLLKTDGIYLKDILPLETDPNIAWLRVPEDKIGSYEVLADFLYAFGEKELKRLNSKLAESALLEAIHCLEKAIKSKPVLDVSQIEDEMLKMDIRSQRADVLRKLREKLKDCYVQIFLISDINRLYDPLQNYMLGVEELCKDLPEMSGIVSEMYAFLRIPNKQREYADLYEIFLGTGARHYE